MAKIQIICFLLLLSISLNSQIPDGYYSTAQGLTGANLKSALYNIIKGHTEYPYTSSNTDTWDILKQTDKDTINPDNVILFYTGESVNAAQEYNNGNGWTREHIWAKSRGDFGTTMGPGTDVHHLRPVDNNTNNVRNNRWFDNCIEPILVNGVPTGCYISSTSWVFKPRDKVKGDVARMIFYMATRYEGENGEPNLEVIDYLPADNNTTEPIHAKLSALLQWNIEDPVDNFERNRNNVVHSYQHNRNPFIDHPEYINLIWDTLTSINSTQASSNIEVYPIPTKDYLNISIQESGEMSNFTLRIFDLLGKKVYETRLEHSFFQLELSSLLDKGIYILKVSDEKNTFITIKKIILQ